MDPGRAAREVRKLPAENVTVGLWLASWRVFFPSERNAETAEHDDYMLNPFIARHGRKLLSAITPLMAQQWAVKHPGQVRYLRLAWDKAFLMQMVPFNVWKCVELPRRTEPTRGVPTLEQLDGALARCLERGGWYVEFADLVEAAAFTGARLGGMVTLKRSQVDLEARRVILHEKGGKSRTVVLTPRSEDALCRGLTRSRRRLNGLVFSSQQGQPLVRYNVGKAWRAIRGDFDGPFHSLKHFAGTWLASLGVDERDIAVQLGHFDSQGRPYTALVRRVYVHPDHEQALARIEALTTNERNDDGEAGSGEPVRLSPAA